MKKEKFQDWVVSCDCMYLSESKSGPETWLMGRNVAEWAEKYLTRKFVGKKCMFSEFCETPDPRYTIGVIESITVTFDCTERDPFMVEIKTECGKKYGIPLPLLEITTMRGIRIEE